MDRDDIRAAQQIVEPDQFDIEIQRNRRIDIRIGGDDRVAERPRLADHRPPDRAQADQAESFRRGAMQ
ncbi:MAG: hypothetical protein AVDCRST_MAG18-4313 [uncultured Thermomicrobiales bacterium]|uniref:Uncharacterized protein n=1 Tax=uncultured Thermomicrobiales bacterium TaxID=1645740 RepID=A0A6J4VT01_9BACT|nr:MAG: hypothetical protein AVDCRST_MAG18-4313 [uncultured Thermomicrobiales bacterium]